MVNAKIMKKVLVMTSLLAATFYAQACSPGDGGVPCPVNPFKEVRQMHELRIQQWRADPWAWADDASIKRRMRQEQQRREAQDDRHVSPYAPMSPIGPIFNPGR